MAPKLLAVNSADSDRGDGNKHIVRTELIKKCLFKCAAPPSELQLHCNRTIQLGRIGVQIDAVFVERQLEDVVLVPAR